MGRGKKVYWGALILEWFNELNELDLGRGDYKVLFFICSEINPQDNVAYIKQKYISGSLQMDPGNVSKSIKRLKEYQFIVKLDNGFMLNPHLFYIGKGHSVDRWILREKFDSFLDGNQVYSLNETDGELIIERNQSSDNSEEMDEYLKDDFNF